MSSTRLTLALRATQLSLLLSLWLEQPTLSLLPPLYLSLEPYSPLQHLNRLTQVQRFLFTNKTQFSLSLLDFVQSLRQDIAATPSPTPHPPPSLTAPNSHPHHLQPPPSKRPHTTTQPPATPSSAAKTKKKQKAKSSPSTRRKKEHDSGAPKKPSNAFFWFCQEQRRSLEEQFRGEGVAGQHSLTKILAQKWGETTNDDKKVCIYHHFHS